MNFLPFVISFLIILMLGSSVLFSSLRSTIFEKKVILANQIGKLSLISEQAEKDYKRKTKDPAKRNKDGEKKESKNKKTTQFKDRRNQREGLEISKFDIGPLLKNKDNKTLKEALVRLIELLYKDADFYKESSHKNLAQTIVYAMLQNKEAEDLNELFPTDPALAEIYYKMLKGTNTSYHALSEYIKIASDTGKSIHFAYATTPILKAFFGEEMTQRILKQEKENWEKNHRMQNLKKEDLKGLLQAHSTPNFDINKLEEVFDFNKVGVKKGALASKVDPLTKIKASR